MSGGEFLQEPVERAPREGDPSYGDRDWLHGYIDCPDGYERIEIETIVESVVPVYGPDGEPIGLKTVLLPIVGGTIRPIPTGDTSHNEEGDSA